MQITPFSIRMGIKSLFLYLYYTAGDFGLFSDHKNFTRFVILSGPRSGTNFLRSALNAHSRIFVFGELFGSQNKIGWDCWAFNNLPFRSSKLNYSLMESHPDIFLNDLMYRSPPQKFSSVGFKIFYFHAKKGSGEKVWKYLSNNKKIKIVHVKRQNMLSTFLSHRKALQNNYWVELRKKKISQPIYIDPYECKSYFERMTKWQNDSDQIFSGHSKIDVFYEKMVQNRGMEFKRVQNFLEVENCGIKPGTLKQAKKTLSEDILNYEELFRYFKNTKWESFFIEDNE